MNEGIIFKKIWGGGYNFRTPEGVVFVFGLDHYLYTKKMRICFSLQIAEQIRHVIDRYNKAIPAILEIPSKDHPYDPTKDSILRRAKVCMCVIIIGPSLNPLKQDHP